MPKFVIDQLDYGLSQFLRVTGAGRERLRFCRAPGLTGRHPPSRSASLLWRSRRPRPPGFAFIAGRPDFPGFKITPFQRPFDLTPVLLTDKEIYRAGKDRVRLLAVTPAWLYTRADHPQPETANLTIENNGVVLRSQLVKLNEGGLTLVDLGALPQGHYRVFWPGTNENAETKPAECEFSSVEYVLAPLQATLQGYEFSGNQLTCRLKVERLNEPLTEPVQLELWSGANRLDSNKAKAGLPGVYQARFKVKTKSQARLEVRVSTRIWSPRRSFQIPPGPSDRMSSLTRLVPRSG